MRNNLFLIALTCLCAFTLFSPNTFAQDDSSEYVVRAIYFIPKDREPDPNMDEKLDTLIKDVQQFYADQMEAHGFGRKTFTLETDESGRILAHRVKGEFNEAYYRENFGKALIEINTKFEVSKNINLVIIDTSLNFGGFASGDGSGGNAVISAATNDFISLSAHELGHAFGLGHDWRNESYIMTYAEHPSVLSGCAAEWLDAHKYFNPANKTFNDNTTVKMLIPELVMSPAAIRLQFEITDPDGLHQAQLILPSEQGYSLFGCRSLNEDSVIIEFVTTELLAIESGTIFLNVIDSQGNIIELFPFQIDITPILPDSEPVSIPDVNLAAVVRETLGLAPNSSITQLDILKLTKLEVRENLNISDLTGLEHATHLQILTLEVNQIQDMTPLTKLTKLKRVILTNNQLSNIPSLVGMKQLTTLYLNNNQISDITPLQELTQLTDLAIDGNPINTENLFSVLTQLTRLRTLLLYGMKIRDITPLAKLTQLRTLGLTWNPISDITPLAALTNLRILYLSGSQISDITPLKGLGQLRHLFLDDNQISDVKPLAELVNLKELGLIGNPIKDKKPLLELLRKNPDVKIYLKNYDEPLTVLEPPQRTEDINGDGVVNIQDLVQVAGALGETGQNAGDVNGDGVVNIQDLVQVAGALGEAAAAPSRHPQVLETFTAAEVQLWLTAAASANLSDAKSQRGIRFLAALLAALTPKKTALLANYPNPFNPETWIPYQLASPADVTLHIHTIDGSLVRTLSLGHKPLGIYESRSRAAYWDGRNALGEPVASGVYFYTLTAGDFTATRKMLIRK